MSESRFAPGIETIYVTLVYANGNDVLNSWRPDDSELLYGLPRIGHIFHTEDFKVISYNIQN